MEKSSPAIANTVLMNIKTKRERKEGRKKTTLILQGANSLQIGICSTEPTWVNLPAVRVEFK